MIENSRSVQIILSTYNGERYLPDFIESIENLEFKSLSILIKDDFSDDSTFSIINNWVSNSKYKISIITDSNDDNIGWKKSFDKLIKFSSADIVFFADQDDIWHPKKIKLMLSFINSIDGPALVVHNADIIDANNLTISTNQLLGFDSIPISINNSQNITGGLYGCCTAVNRELIDLYIKYNYGEILGHDCALTIIALIKGKILHINSPLIFWRTHDSNSSRKIGLRNRFNQLIYLFMISKFEIIIVNNFNTNEYFQILKVFLSKLKYLFNKKLKSP